MSYDGYDSVYTPAPADWSPLTPTYGQATTTKHIPIGLSLAITHTVQGTGGGGTNWSNLTTLPTNWTGS